ncbi:hypothetical protein PIB30_111301, partial [Stylosanthes scabra]|nr:hypothetical protein [Stylosanthes scabra]
ESVSESNCGEGDGLETPSKEATLVEGSPGNGVFTSPGDVNGSSNKMESKTFRRGNTKRKMD